MNVTLKIIKAMYVYINSEPNLWTVGFYSPDGEWHPDSDHDIREKAAQRVAWLNGGGIADQETESRETETI